MEKQTQADIRARADYAKEVIETAVKTGTMQIVVLFGELDVPFPLDHGNPSLRVFEVDRPAVVTMKRLQREKAGLDTPKESVLVPLSKEKKLVDVLRQAGLDRRKKTAFLWLGKSYTATEGGIERLLHDIDALSADGSALIFDYLEAAYPDHKRDDAGLQAMARGKAAVADLTYAELESLLERQGFLIFERLTPDEIEEKYFGSGERSLPISYVTAVVKKRGK